MILMRLTFLLILLRLVELESDRFKVPPRSFKLPPAAGLICLNLSEKTMTFIVRILFLILPFGLRFRCAVWFRPADVILRLW